MPAESGTEPQESLLRPHPHPTMPCGLTPRGSVHRHDERRCFHGARASRALSAKRLSSNPCSPRGKPCASASRWHFAAAPKGKGSRVVPGPTIAPAAASLTLRDLAAGPQVMTSMPHSLRRGPKAAVQKLVRSHHVRAMFRGHHSLPCCLKGCCAKPIRVAVQGASAAMDTKCMHQRQSALQHMMNHRWVSLSMLAKENSVATTQPIFRTQQSSSASEIINHSLLLPRCNKTCCCACQRKSGAACSAMLSMIAHHVRGGGGAERGVRSMCAAACGSTVAATNASDANILLPTWSCFLARIFCLKTYKNG